MDTSRPTPGSGAGDGSTAPVTEADLHAFVDAQLPPARRVEVEQFLATRPDERQRVADWQEQNRLLRGMLAPALDEPLPLRLPLAPVPAAWPWRGLAAGLAIAVVSAGSAWLLRGSVDARAARLALGAPGFAAPAGGSTVLAGFAERAAIAHLVYSPDARRPVEVSADQEQALVTWLTKRMGTAVRAPTLSELGYELIGGRLLPGEKGPVAQFMYAAKGGARLTLYVTREAAGQDTAFRFGHEGAVNVFYWVDRNFGYAISAGADRDELLRVSQAVYAQLSPK